MKDNDYQKKKKSGREMYLNTMLREANSKELLLMYLEKI